MLQILFVNAAFIGIIITLQKLTTGRTPVLQPDDMTNITNTIDSMHMLHDSPLINLYWKDTQGQYLCVNQTFLLSSAMNDEQEVVGKKDCQLAWHKQATDIKKNDHTVFKSGNSHTLIEYIKCTPTSRVNTFLSHKSPLKNPKGKIIGLFGLSCLIEDTANNGANNQPKLTQRQIACLVCLIQGMTYKQIGRKLNLSPKTIEHYIAAIKEKLNCHTRTELIQKSLQIPCIRMSVLL